MTGKRHQKPRRDKGTMIEINVFDPNAGNMRIPRMPIDEAVKDFNDTYGKPKLGKTLKYEREI